jgi:hypothetical protein
VRPDRDRDGFVGDGGIWLVPRLEPVEAGLVVIELIGQEGLVVVPVGVEGPDRVGVVGEALIARHMPHRRPGLPAIPRLVKAVQVVVAFGAGEPLGRPDEVLGIGWIDSDV